MSISVTFSFNSVAEAAAFLENRTGTVSEDAPAAPQARTRGRPPKATAEAAQAPAAAPVAAPAAPVVDAADLKKEAIQKLVMLINANDALGRNGKQVCTDLCLKFGGANISKIDPARYPAVIAQVEKELEAINSDPTA